MDESVFLGTYLASYLITRDVVTVTHQCVGNPSLLTSSRREGQAPSGSPNEVIHDGISEPVFDVS